MGEQIDISEDELLNEILKNITLNSVNLTKHSIERIEERPIELDWIYSTLMNLFPVYIEKQGLDLFKLHYPHPDKDTKDLIIVVVVDKKIIKVVTTYEQDIERR